MTFRFVSKLPEKLTDNATIPGHPEYQNAIHDISESLGKIIPSHFEVETNYTEMNFRGLSSLNESLVGVNGVLQLRRGTSEALVKALESNSTNFVHSNGIFGPFEAHKVDLKGSLDGSEIIDGQAI